MRARVAYEASSDVATPPWRCGGAVGGLSGRAAHVDARSDWLNPPDPNRIDADGNLVWHDGGHHLTLNLAVSARPSCVVVMRTM